MRVAPLARRTAATLTATALLLTGGTASGLLVGLAHAADTISPSPSFKGNTDSDANNASVVFTNVGGNFDPSATTSVVLSSTFNKASVFPNFGKTGAAGGGGTYYFDDLIFIP